MAGALLLAGVLAAGEGLAQSRRERSREIRQVPSELIECDGDRCRLEYDTEIEGLGDTGIGGVLNGSSQLIALEERPPESLAGLRRRAEADLERMVTAMKSEGYYSGRASYRIDTSRDPVQVILTVDPGPAYRMRRTTIIYENQAEIPQDVRLPQNGAEIGLARDSIGRGPAIIGAQGRLSSDIRLRGFPFVTVGDRKVVLNLQERTVEVTFRVDTGPRARFGALQVSGLERVEEQFVRGYVPWEEGMIYNPNMITAYAQRLESSGLFSSVRVRGGDEIGEDGALPIIAEFAERPRRSLGFGVEYSTAEGPGFTTFWEHRNLSGEGEKLRIEFEAAQIRTALVGSYSEPQFFRPDQTLLTRLELKSERTDAFDSNSVLTSIGVEREVRPGLKAGLAAEFEYARVIEEETKDDTFLIAFPATLTVDKTDDFLNPRTGYRLSALASPAVGWNEVPILFRTYEVEGSTYVPLDEEKRYVLAARLRLALIEGEQTSDIPAQRRLYVGGGGSLRGYAFQEAGRFDATNDPEGGRSAVEAGFEVRTQITPSIGIAPFIEVGGAFRDSVPHSDDDWFTGAGGGIWYDTPVGPFRLDIAVPLYRREGVDEAFQVYLSLGQSF